MGALTVNPGDMVIRKYDGLVGRVIGVEANRNRIAVQWKRDGIISITRDDRIQVFTPATVAGESQ